MSKYHWQKKLDFFTGELYQIVSEVDKYPLFIPWINSAELFSSSSNEFIAELLIKFKIFREKFTSKVELIDHDSPNYSIITTMIEGPLDYLDTKWSFNYLSPTKTDLTFEVNFHFNSLLLQSIASLYFKGAIEKIMQAFLARAQKLRLTKQL